MAETVAVRGLRELRTVLAKAGPDTKRELDAALKRVAEPIRSDAESLAAATIPRLGVPWSKMRIGVTQKVVYVAPVKRGVKGRGTGGLRRPNLADLLMGRAMQPALERNIGEVMESIDRHVLGGLAHEWER